MELPQPEYSLASNVAMSLSQGMNALWELIQRIDGPILSEPRAPLERVDLLTAMSALEWSMTELLANKRFEGAPSLDEGDVALVRRLGVLIHAWQESAELPQEAGTLARRCLSTLVGEEAMKSLPTKAERMPG